MLWNGSEGDEDVSGEWEQYEGTNSEGGDSDIDW